MGNDFAAAVRKGDSPAVAAGAGRKWDCPAAAGNEVVHHERLGMVRGVHRTLRLVDTPCW